MLTLQRFLVVLIFVVVSAPAHAEQLAAGILNLRGEGVDASLVNTLSSIVRNEAQQVEKYQVVNKYEINLQDILIVLNCSAESTACMQQVAEQVKARILIYGTIERKGGSFLIELAIFDAQSGRVLNKLNKTIADTDDPVIAFRQEIETFFARERGAATTRVQIGSSVSDAQIFMEDTFVGTVPLERKGLPAGKYQIRVEHPDYEPWTQLLELKEGGDESLWAQLKPRAGARSNDVVKTRQEIRDDVKIEDERVGTINWGAWSAVGAGGLALVGSGVFAVLMGNIEQQITDESREGITERRYNELVERGEGYETAHRVLLGVGAVCVIGGVTWLLISPDGGRKTAELGFTGNQVVGTLRW